MKLPAKTTIQIQTYALHRNSMYFELPEKFDPNRFLKDSQTEHNGNKICSCIHYDRHPFAYIPFGTRDTSCIGEFNQFP